MKSFFSLSLAALAAVAAAVPVEHGPGRVGPHGGPGSSKYSSSAVAASTTAAAATSSAVVAASSSVAVSSVAVSSVAVSSATAVAAVASSSSTPTVYLAGDSTMAKGGGGTGTEGWGVFLPYSLTGVKVVNDAKAGTSARSYTNESRFQDIADVVTSGDWVIIEFGHNDGGSLSTTDNLRTDCYGAGSETCTSVNGDIVQTYPTYITAAAKLMTAKGAQVIISPPTPDNPCETGTCSYTAPRFTAYANSSAAAVGSMATFIDHGQHVANAFEALGPTTVDAFYPNDHTHPSPTGSTIVAAQFVLALLCSKNPLAAHVVNTTSSITGSCV
ncbi:SGNH hydrolase-2 [Coleophoma crateriformis]|uniref:SGNH hydrolase-2 n=1 Tax=Coleophoma crateriformis TaxID=565419 RepID=A0A3D8R7F2_9HELO|nr:SGNH hydrolase-2 [Coleophoma crateriformis]